MSVPAAKDVTPPNPTEIRRYKRNTNIGVAAGIVILGIARAAGAANTPEATGAAASPATLILIALMVISGYAAFIWGCCNYAMKKGHHWAWGLLGFLSLLGLLVLFFMRDRTKLSPS
jgi:hypothetical protein